MARQDGIGKTQHVRRNRVRLLLRLFVLTIFITRFTYRNVQQGKKNQALVAAVEDTDINRVRILLRQGADPNAHRVRENTPHTPIQVFQWMIRSREIVWHNSPVLVDASVRRDAQIVKILLDSGADINATSQYHWTALMNAASAGRTEAVLVLLNRGANINIRSEGGKTALKLAIQYDRPDIVQVLKRAGARE